MHDITLFGEDHAHEVVVGALVTRIAEENGIDIRQQWRSATGGHGRVARQLDRYLRGLRSQSGPWPELIVVATDANCHGLRERVRQVTPRHVPDRLFSRSRTRTSSAGCSWTALPSRRCLATAVRHRTGSAAAIATRTC